MNNKVYFLLKISVSFSTLYSCNFITNNTLSFDSKSSKLIYYSNNKGKDQIFEINVNTKKQKSID